jgi:hypothetical protein
MITHPLSMEKLLVLSEYALTDAPLGSQASNLQDKWEVDIRVRSTLSKGHGQEPGQKGFPHVNNFFLHFSEH